MRIREESRVAVDVHSCIFVEVVGCGSVVKITHRQSEHNLHSHEIAYGTGSGQQSVTAHGGRDDQGALWIVQEGNGQPDCTLSRPIVCGSTIRLTHLQTMKNLHSHKFQSPLTKGQEVSAFGDKGQGDESDNWILECEGNSKYWYHGIDVYFKHEATGGYLYTHSSYAFDDRNCRGCPIIGQREVSAIGGKKGTAKWYADQGLYFIEP